MCLQSRLDRWCRWWQPGFFSNYEVPVDFIDPLEKLLNQPTDNKTDILFDEEAESLLRKSSEILKPTEGLQSLVDNAECITNDDILGDLFRDYVENNQDSMQSLEVSATKADENNDNVSEKDFQLWIWR